MIDDFALPLWFVVERKNALDEVLYMEILSVSFKIPPRIKVGIFK